MEEGGRREITGTFRRFQHPVTRVSTTLPISPVLQPKGSSDNEAMIQIPKQPLNLPGTRNGGIRVLITAILHTMVSRPIS